MSSADPEKLKEEAWAHLDEAYDWMPVVGGYLSTQQKFPDHYARIPKTLYKELEAAWDALKVVTNKVDKYRGKR